VKTCKINTGGYAFPQPDLYEDGNRIEIGESGMSLRDYFAAKALSGLCALNWQQAYNQHPPSAEEYAENAYCIAEAMIKAREVSQ
jgi:hypothetical protein